MKKLISILLIVVLLFSIFSLVACDIVGSGTGQGGSFNNGGTTNNGGTSIDDNNDDDQTGGSLNSGGSAGGNLNDDSNNGSDSTGGNNSNDNQNGNSGTEVAETRYVDLYAINDFHGQTDKIARVGGFLKEKKEQDGNTVLLNSGDMFQETLESSSNYGSLLNNCMAEIGIECMTIGNHEFDWGLDTLQKLSEQTSVKFLGANIYHWSKTDGWGTYANEIAEPYYIRMLENGLKVGIIGIIGSSQITSISSNLVSTIGFKEPEDVVPTLSQKLREEEKCDVVIVSTHNSAEDTIADDDLDMSQYADAVFCAHSHYVELETKNGVTFIQGGSKGNYVSNVRLAVDKDGKVTTVKSQNIKYQSSWTNDQTIAQMVEKSNNEIEATSNQVIATLSGYFGNGSSYSNRSTHEMPRLVSKAIASFAKEQGYDIDLAMVNQTRNAYSGGDITYRELFNTIPFDNIVYIAEVSGKDLIKQASYKNFWRVTDQPIVENGTYTIAVIDYVLFHQNAKREYNYFPSAFENDKTPVALVTEQNSKLNYRDITKAYLLQQEIVYASDFADSNPHTNVNLIGENVTFTDVGQNIFSGLNYVAWGDSITYGVDGVNGGRMANPYPTLVAKNLGLKSFSNKGISGATFCSNDLNRTNMTSNILACTEQADIVSVMLGVNDFAANLPLGTIYDKDNTTIYGSLYLICEHFKQYYSDSFVFFMTPFPYKKGITPNAQGYTLEDVADAVKYMAEKYDYLVLDMFNVSNYQTEMNSSSSDGLHPSQDYFKNYGAPKIVSFIRQNYTNNIECIL